MFLTVLMTLSAGNCIAAKRQKTVTWEDVKTVYRNTSAMKVTKVELTDTAAILHIHSQFRPKQWIRISKGSTLTDMQGNTYALKGAHGITPGKEFYMPESGEHDFTLRFMPMPVTTTMFDFKEGDSNDDWKLFGIYSGKNTPDFGIPDEVRNIKKTANETLPATRYAPGKAKINCKVYGYRKETNVKMSTFYYDMGSNQKSIETPIGDDGMAIIELDLKAPTVINMGINRIYYATLYAIPGEEIDCVLNMNAQNDTFHFAAIKGTLARTMNDINNVIPIISNEISTNNKIDILDTIENGNMKSEDVPALINKKFGEMAAAIDNYAAYDLTDATKQLWRMQMEQENLKWRFNLAQEWRDAKYQLEKDRIKSSKEYDDFMNEINKNIPEAIRGNFTEDMPDMECLNSDHALFGEVLTSYLTKRKEFLPLVTNDYNRQLVTVHCFLNETMPIDEATEATITDSSLKQLIADTRAERKKLEEELAKTGNVYFKTYDDVAPEEIEQLILDKYKNKVVFIDVWATWCGPCRAGHKQMIPLKEEMKNKDVVFVYITSQTSPVATWNVMIKDIDGEHYYLTREQYNHLLDKYESQGIPTYLLFDKTGRLSFKSIGSRSNEEFKKEIEKVLE